MEANLQSNFNVGFTNMKSDVLIHLTQWQYWWWFWFSLLWAFYYLMILKMVRFRSLKFRPRIATTLRPHGKWGDLIICIIPVSWCANIITNSNFILRMIEWQSESGLLTVRIRGKQWYWVYKFELKTFTDVFTVPKNIGHNKWQISTPSDLQVADDYLHVLQLRSQNRWVKSYWDELTQEVAKSKDFNLISPQEQLRFNFFKTYNQDYMYTNMALIDFNNYVLHSFSNPDYLEIMSKYPEQGLPIKEQLFPIMGKLYVMFTGSGDDDKDLSIYDNISPATDLSDYNSNYDYTSFYEKLEEDVERDFESETNFEVVESESSVDNNVADKSEEDADEEVEDVSDSEFFHISKKGFENFIDLRFISERNQHPSEFNDLDLVGKFDEIYDLDRDSLEDSSDFSIFSENENFINYRYKTPKDITDPSMLNIEHTYDVKQSEILFNIGHIYMRPLSYDNILLRGGFYNNFAVRFNNKKTSWDDLSGQLSFDESFINSLDSDSVNDTRLDYVNKVDLFSNLFEDQVKFKSPTNNSFYYNYSDFSDFDKVSRKSQGSTSPLRLIKYPVSNKTNFDFDSDTLELFRFRFNESESSSKHRITPNSSYLTIRQKRYFYSR